jgi:hypothetical protein
MSEAEHSEKNKWLYACRIFATNSFKDGVMWHLDPLPGTRHGLSPTKPCVTRLGLALSIMTVIGVGT